MIEARAATCREEAAAAEGMALWLVPERHTGEDNLECGPLTLLPGEVLTVGKRDVDKKDAKLSKMLFRIQMVSEEEASITRIGRTPIHCIPKGETGKLVLTQEGVLRNDSSSSERLFLGQTWFAWAEGQRVRDQLRSLQLQTLGGHALSEDDIKRVDELEKEVTTGLAVRAAAAASAVAAAAAAAAGAAAAAAAAEKEEASHKERKKEKNGDETKNREKREDSGRQCVNQALAPKPPVGRGGGVCVYSTVDEILGECPPDFPQGACGRVEVDQTHLESGFSQSDIIKKNLRTLGALQEGEKLWVDPHTGLIEAQRGGALRRMIHRQGRSLTASWSTRFHSSLRSFIEKEIVQVECGRADARCMEDMSALLSAATQGLQALRRVYTGDVATQAVLSNSIKELSLTAKMCESYLARLRGEQPRLVT